MSKLPWWLNQLAKILLVDFVIALLVGVWSWLAQDFTTIALSNRFFMGGVIAVMLSLGAGLGNWQNRSDWR